MGSSRESSPDWVRSFQAPQTFTTLSSDSESPPDDDSPVRDDVSCHKEKPEHKTFQEKDHNQDMILIDSGGESPVSKAPKTKSTKSRAKTKKEQAVHDTTEFPEKDQKQDMILIDIGGESSVSKASKTKSPKARAEVENHEPPKKKKIGSKNQREGEVADKEIVEKHIETHVSTSRLPLVLSEKVHRSKVLVECEGDSIDMSGDVGSVGRIVISDTPTGNQDMFFDLKGTIYKTTIVPSRTFCIVNFGQAEAKIEAVMNDFIQLKPQSNVYEAETMIEGTLDGFMFDSEEEADKMPKSNGHQTDQNNEGEEQTAGKTKGKVEKPLGVNRKKGKMAGKLPKKVKKKSQAPKKAKPSKK
ncbi:DNA-binding protein BIN4 isoform X2 [Telopea speciosissima]|uniref:DNA-binding protein BIN4 isoform X2 n=1 Tax=Telopea speciosissima TaxID=54955 RepID=UPI001CC6C149|nr:DNA-binding protein BIN4 isoform X2 [Telopea speciosissima]